MTQGEAFNCAEPAEAGGRDLGVWGVLETGHASREMASFVSVMAQA